MGSVKRQNMKMSQKTAPEKADLKLPLVRLGKGNHRQAGLCGVVGGHAIGRTKGRRWQGNAT